MKTYLVNSKGKQLYENPENIKRAQRLRKAKSYCKGLIKSKYMLDLAPYKRTPMVVTL